MDALKSLMQPLVGGAGGSSVIDGMKLVVLGGTVETARRASSSAWSHFLNSFFLTAHFSEEDYPYDWLMLWLSRRPEWQRSREFETTTRTTTPGFSGSRQADNSFGDEEEEEGDEDSPPGKVKTRVVFQPTFDTTHTIYYKGHWLRVRRSKKQDSSGCEVLSISVVARNNTILKQLVLQAKKEYEAEAIHRIQIYFADSHGSWRWTDSRHKRPMSSIVLNPGVKEMLLNDTRDFLKSEKWYADRGIPFRRGYLLHGVPGSGKSSLIHAIAGELMLDIYVVDSTLTTLMGRVPARCIVLLEDLDAAFTRSVTRDKSSNGTPDSSSNSSEESTPEQPVTSSSSRHRHGVAAAEGRILFATTNHLERLDPALSRPGRMDVWVEFKNSSKWQAEALFRNFFPSTDQDNEGIELPTTPTPQSPSSNSSSQSSTFVVAFSFVSRRRRCFALKASARRFGSKNQAYLPPPVEEHLNRMPAPPRKPLDGFRLGQLAKMFADSIPDRCEFSVAALQGSAAWVISERELRERLRKEKGGSCEIKEKLDREKRRKELLEKEKEKAELEKKELELAKLRQQLQEQEAKDNLPVEKSTKDDDKGEPSTDEDSDEENIPPPSTPPEAVRIQVADWS
ncbi:uncharacterized protein EDB91DRAFT_1234814 [Suillus paluster]|uniref:uncharacterized protein n=1 Tax=Suillus paluster TaxID=48578 RepID=UPI001B871208|nr:uncharacterized protein EDB91DRAFT_1234814 [Suillus paluster]KAG1751425.1 hypothetical protein EDB91DRAFT_1234814 [Suillus paluster]